MNVFDVTEYRSGSSSWYTLRPFAPFGRDLIVAPICAFIRATSAFACAECPVIVPSCSIWRYEPARFGAAGCSRTIRCGAARPAGAAAGTRARLSARATSPASLVLTTKNLRLSAEEVDSGGESARISPSSEGVFVRRDTGDLARPRRASQLRDSTGFAPASLWNTG